MHSISLVLLLASTQYTNVQAAVRLQPRQIPITYGPLATIPAKASMDHCRVHQAHVYAKTAVRPLNPPLLILSPWIDLRLYSILATLYPGPRPGSWTNDPLWQCQKPGQSPTSGTVASTGGDTPQSGAAVPIRMQEQEMGQIQMPALVAVLLRLPRQAQVGLQAAEIRLPPHQVKVAAHVAAVAHQRERYSLLPVAFVVRRLC